MDLTGLLLFPRWIIILGLVFNLLNGASSQRATASVSRTTIRSTSRSSSYIITRTRTSILRRAPMLTRSPGASLQDRPCPRPTRREGLIQFITVDQNAKLTDTPDTYPPWTTINYACQDPERAVLEGSRLRKCIMGVWTSPEPTCRTVRTQFGLVTSPYLPRSPTSDGSLAVYLTSYATHVGITCTAIGGTPELSAEHIPADSPRTERYETRMSGGEVVSGIRIARPQAGDGGRFVCVDRANNDMHSINITFDDQRYALRDPCPDDVTVSTQFNLSHAFVEWEPPSLSDTTGNIQLLSHYGPGNRFNLGKTNVVYNASDILGMVEVCFFTITVVDTEPPTIEGCPDDISVPTDPGRAMAQVSWEEPTPTDNAGIHQVTMVAKTQPGTYFGIGSFAVSYTATDMAGNEATCSFSISVEDREPPQLTCPPDIVVDTLPNSLFSHANWSRPSVSDNSGHTITINDPGTEDTFTYGTSNRTYVVRDGSGNTASCSFSIRVRDTEPPRFINCPRHIVRYIETKYDNTTAVDWAEPLADDNVGPSLPWYRSHAPKSRFGVGEHQVVYVVRDLEGNNATCEFDVTVIAARCPAEKTEVNGITYNWPSTPTSTLAPSDERCPINTVFGGHPQAIRFCAFDDTALGIWRDFRVRTCGYDISPLDLLELSQVYVTKYNIKEMARYVEAVVANQTEFDTEDIRYLSMTMQEMAEVESPSKTVSNSFVEITDHVAESDLSPVTKERVGADLRTILQTLDRQLMESALSNKKLHIATRSIAARTVSVYPADVTDGLTFAPVTSDKDDEADADEEEEDKAEKVIRTILKNDTLLMQKHLQMDASIQLPPIVFEAVFNGTQVPVSFVVFKDDTLFPSARLRRLQANSTYSVDGTTWPPGGADTTIPSRTGSPRPEKITKVLGPVLSASVAGGDLVNLSDPVVIEFSVEEGVNITNVQCVFWDFDLDGQRGDWSNEGCQFAGRRMDGGIICHCNHLTNFAVLVDIYGQFEIDQKEKLVLDVITRIGCFLSIAGLAFTILTFVLFKSLRASRSRQILVHLCIALISLYIVFVCGIVATRVQPACVATAAILHYLVLVVVMWMGVEARHMYVMLVKVFKSERSRFVIKAAVVAWGIPIPAVAISLGLSFHSYHNEAYCFLRPGHVMYYGLLLPIAVILLHNIITFSLAIRNLLCSNMSGNAVNKTKKEQIISRLQNAICMSVLLGLTWSFGFLAVGEATFAFRLIFCLFNSFQGFIIFALFCVRSKEVRSAWSSLSIIECNIRSQSYRVKEKSYHANSESAWNGPCVIDWGDAPGLEAYMQANKQKFRDSANSEESRLPTYSVTAVTGLTVNSNNKITNPTW